ncbi:MAG: histidine kinase [Oscillospiraceae bacterium]|jgi:signal transduction histidine kinase|nr:histidine kinase [Oscillospiraceae bacterium]
MNRRSSNFKHRLFWGYAVVTVAIVALFAAALIATTVSLNRETERMHQQETFEANLAQIESLLQQADRLASQVASNVEILGSFIPLRQTSAPAAAQSNYFADNLLDAIRLSSLLATLNGVEGFADRISVYNEYGDYVSAGRLYETPERVASSLENTDNIINMIHMVRSRPTRCVVKGFHRDAWSDHPGTRYISLYRTLSYWNGETGDSYGLVEVQIDTERLLNMAFWRSDSDASPGHAPQYAYALLDIGEGAPPSILYPEPSPTSDDAELRDAELIGAALSAWPGYRDSGARTVSVRARIGGRAALLMAAQPLTTDWLLVRSLTIGELDAPYLSSYLFMSLGCFALLMLMLVVVNWLAERISRPLRALAASIGNVSLHDLRLRYDARREPNATRELSALDDAFRSLMNRLDQSIALEMRAYMRALRSQIQPHFLNNTFSVLVAAAEEAGDARTVSMCLKLADMLRYSADFARDSVTLAQELAHTRDYLELMQVRYEELLSFSLDADERALMIPLPKLSIQPLVENCFTHGFKNEPPWRVTVAAQIQGAKWRLRVEDNGVGMSEQAIVALLGRLEAYRVDVASSFAELSEGGLGFIGTMLRLSAADASVRCSVANCPEGGLSVEIEGELRD